MHRAVALLSAAAVLLSAPAAAATADDTASVPKLIAAYHEAVLAHDGTRLAALFVPEGSAWFSALTDKGLAQVRATKPDARRLKPGSVAQFVSMVSTSRKSLDPQHSDLRIVSGDAVATVTFHFRFLIDGREENSGIESWQLVRGDDGWRIASIVFSSTPAPPRPAPPQ